MSGNLEVQSYDHNLEAVEVRPFPEADRKRWAKAENWGSWLIHTDDDQGTTHEVWMFKLGQKVRFVGRGGRWYGPERPSVVAATYWAYGHGWWDPNSDVSFNARCIEEVRRGGAVLEPFSPEAKYDVGDGAWVPDVISPSVGCPGPDADELETLRGLLQAWEPRVSCPQCGKRYSAAACGPTHGIIHRFVYPGGDGTPMAEGKRVTGSQSPTHEFHALWWHLGPYGRQDVHLHSCITHERCQVELVGEGRDCKGRDAGQYHVRKRLAISANGWQNRHKEGTSLYDGEARRGVS